MTAAQSLAPYVSNSMGFLFMLTVALALKGKSRALRFKVAGGLALFALACFAALFISR